MGLGLGLGRRATAHRERAMHGRVIMVSNVAQLHAGESIARAILA